MKYFLISAFSIIGVCCAAAVPNHAPETLATVAQVRPADPISSPPDDRLVALETKIDKVLAISQQTLSAIDGLKESNTANAMSIVAAIEKLNKPATVKRYVEQCGPNGCRLVEIKDVQPVPIDDPGSPGGGYGDCPDGCASDCGCGCMSQSSIQRVITFQRRNLQLFPRLRALFQK
jgi:hypothetical protein